MKITLHAIPIRDLVNGFEDKSTEKYRNQCKEKNIPYNEVDDGVVGYGGKLNIRPPYQREFVYKDKQRNAVIESIFRDYPLNVIYWVRNKQGNYELLDGQQRTVSICSYYINDYSIKWKGNSQTFSSLTEERKQQFLDYQLQVYICEDGTEEEQIEWFKTINIAGAILTNQEILNAIYTGSWVTDAKRKFSKTHCVAYQLGNRYMNGTPIRQDYLETVLKWISKGEIEKYMAMHQSEKNADREWQYFQQVMAWVQGLFPKYRKEMKGVEWGTLYNKFKDDYHSATDLEAEVSRLMMDDDVTNKKGIYDYVLSGEERKLNIRTFTDEMKREAYERQGGICTHCHKHFDFSEMEGDHIMPWSQGGPTVATNCQMLCRACNRSKSDK